MNKLYKIITTFFNNKRLMLVLIEFLLFFSAAFFGASLSLLITKKGYALGIWAICLIFIIFSLVVFKDVYTKWDRIKPAYVTNIQKEISDIKTKLNYFEKRYFNKNVVGTGKIQNKRK